MTDENEDDWGIDRSHSETPVTMAIIKRTEYNKKKRNHDQIN